MHTDRPTRPAWLVASLAAASAVVAYRISGFLNDLVFMLLDRVYSSPLYWLSGWRYQFGLILGLLLAMFCAIWQHRAFNGKSARASRIALPILVVLALLPIYFDVQTALVSVPAPPELSHPAQDVPGVVVVCRLIDGDVIGDDVVLDNSYFTDAQPHLWSNTSYYVLVSLTSDGQQILERVTSQNVGKRLGVWINGDLRCSPEIVDTSDYLVLLLDLSFRDASDLAAGIMKGRP